MDVPTKTNTNNTYPPYKEKPGISPAIVVLIILIFILLPIGYFVYLASNHTDLFDKAKEFFASIASKYDNDDEHQGPYRGLFQVNDITSIESLNIENPSENTRTIGNNYTGYLDVPIDWTERDRLAGYPLQSFSYQYGTEALFVTTLNTSVYQIPDRAMSSLNDDLKNDSDIKNIGPINSLIIYASGTAIYPRRICYHDKSVDYNQCDYIFWNNDQSSIIYVSLASKDDPKTLEYILKSYRSNY